MDKTTDSLYIVMPAYNEAENLPLVVHEWYPLVERYDGSGRSRLVIVNDGSRDDTLAVLQALAHDWPQLVVIDQPNAGHGATLYRAYQYALDAGADYIFQTDSDGQTRPEEFAAFWQQRKSCPVLIGNRNHREDGWSRIVVTNVLKFVLFCVFGLRVTDANTPFRLMQRDVLAAHLPDVPENFNLTNVLLTVLFLAGGEHVRFLPITFRPRQGGKNSINLPRICRIGLHAIRDFYAIRQQMRQRQKHAAQL